MNIRSSWKKYQDEHLKHVEEKKVNSLAYGHPVKTITKSQWRKEDEEKQRKIRANYIRRTNRAFQKKQKNELARLKSKVLTETLTKPCTKPFRNKKKMQKRCIEIPCK